MIILQLCNTWFVEFGYIRVTVVSLSYYVRATLVTFFVFVLHSPGFHLTFVSFSQYIPIVRLHFVSHSSLSVHSRVFFVLFSSYSFNLRVYSSLFRLYSSQTKNSRTSHEQGEQRLIPDEFYTNMKKASRKCNEYPFCHEIFKQFKNFGAGSRAHKNKTTARRKLTKTRRMSGEHARRRREP